MLHLMPKHYSLINAVSSRPNRHKCPMPQISRWSTVAVRIAVKGVKTHRADYGERTDFSADQLCVPQNARSMTTAACWDWRAV